VQIIRRKLETGVVDIMDFILATYPNEIFSFPGSFPFQPREGAATFTLYINGTGGGGGCPVAPLPPVGGNLSYNIAGGGGGAGELVVEIAVVRGITYQINIGEGGQGATEFGATGTAGQTTEFIRLSDNKGVGVETAEGGQGVAPFTGGATGDFFATLPIIDGFFRAGQAGFNGASSSFTPTTGRGGNAPTAEGTSEGGRGSRPNEVEEIGQVIPALPGERPGAGGGAGIVQLFPGGSGALGFGKNGGSGRVVVVYPMWRCFIEEVFDGFCNTFISSCVSYAASGKKLGLKLCCMLHVASVTNSS
jgi:hypothetical protein